MALTISEVESHNNFRFDANGVALQSNIVARNFAPSADRSCSFGLNGSNPEQIVHNKVGRLLLETTDT